MIKIVSYIKSGCSISKLTAAGKKLSNLIGPAAMPPKLCFKIKVSHHEIQEGSELSTQVNVLTLATTNPKIKNKKPKKVLRNEKFEHTTKGEDHGDINEVSKLYSNAIGYRR